VRTGSGAGIDYCAVRRNTAQVTLDGEDDAGGNRNDDCGTRPFPWRDVPDDGMG
jgi:hypothetical protein